LDAKAWTKTVMTAGRVGRRRLLSNVVSVLRQLEQVHGGRHDSLDQHVLPAARCDRSLRP